MGRAYPRLVTRVGGRVFRFVAKEVPRVERLYFWGELRVTCYALGPVLARSHLVDYLFWVWEGESNTKEKVHILEKAKCNESSKAKRGNKGIRKFFYCPKWQSSRTQKNYRPEGCQGKKWISWQGKRDNWRPRRLRSVPPICNQVSLHEKCEVV